MISDLDTMSSECLSGWDLWQNEDLSMDIACLLENMNESGDAFVESPLSVVEVEDESPLSVVEVEDESPLSVVEDRSQSLPVIVLDDRMMMLMFVVNTLTSLFFNKCLSPAFKDTREELIILKHAFANQMASKNHPYYWASVHNYDSCKQKLAKLTHNGITLTPSCTWLCSVLKIVRGSVLKHTFSLVTQSSELFLHQDSTSLDINRHMLSFVLRCISRHEAKFISNCPDVLVQLEKQEQKCRSMHHLQYGCDLSFQQVTCLIHWIQIWKMFVSWFAMEKDNFKLVQVLLSLESLTSSSNAPTSMVIPSTSLSHTSFVLDFDMK